GRQARVARLDLLPGEPGVELLEPAPDAAPRAHGGRLPRPAATAVGARLQVVMTGDAQHHEVLVRVVAALEQAEAVVDVELPLCAVDAADLAATAPLGDESLPAGRGQGERAGAPVGGSHPLPQGALAEQWGEGAGPV